LRISKLLDEKTIFWATIIPTVLILFALVIYLCFKAFTAEAEINEHRRANRVYDFNDQYHDRIVE